MTFSFVFTSEVALFLFYARARVFGLSTCAASSCCLRHSRNVAVELWHNPFTYMCVCM